jgi:hypothetical protein
MIERIKSHGVCVHKNGEQDIDEDLCTHTVCIASVHVSSESQLRHSFRRHPLVCITNKRLHVDRAL